MAPTIPIDYTGQKESKKFSKARLGDMMGKTRKVSKGNSSGFVPDYRHAVETVAESEGLGSSGRINLEMAASEDSFARKRKRLSMDIAGPDQFGVPIRIWSFSKMSHMERRDLEVRLKNELEQVRMLQSKIASFSSRATTVLPTADIHSFQKGQKRPLTTVETFPKSNNIAAITPGKKKAASGRNGPRTKGGAIASRKAEPERQVPPQNANSVVLMKQCETLLTRMMAHQHAWVFNEPVDIEKHNIPDYFDVIKHPMDLGTVKKKLLAGQYSSPMWFAADVRLTFQNALTYNPVGHDVHGMAGVLSKYFEVRWKPIEKKIPVIADESVASKSSVVIEPVVEHVVPAKKQKPNVVENVNPETDKRVMGALEKQKLSEELEASLEELPESIIEFLKESSLKEGQVNGDEIEIDIDTLGDDTLFMLRKLLDSYFLDKQKNEAKVGQCEIEMRNESGFSNLSVQPQRENEPADEDVDIGGDDPPPISSSTPIEIDKDVDRRNSNCSSSSSSTTESGSSSSESDSGNSLAGEQDGAKDSVANTANEDAEPKLDQKQNGDGDVEQSPSNSSFIEPNCHQEGENAPEDRQVSPDKLYRAALLRSRFADIIIKAQENANEKGERPDPEKLKLEREELERRRREEKARLLAEAKAAEDARRKTEEEAAAEARKKRELEREAARQALQQMEKTVDINENSQFMEDLEMFRAAPDEHIQSFTEEVSPDNSQNGLGSFKFEASTNPLEQLGLYMKNDDDEEEEVGVQRTPDSSNDTEEGEID